ncbi:hypothetical protein [Nostoc sp. 'Peltigera malacea cyanobiont' DB3992]|uniref:hypothetical protein n=1 Tax=Nostoc sp. 'Peltigera malacea cyanobiont' DB3992 TaxID=1206980 RepID=UPI00117FD975|nr:hypothetical protein [Nostoc sp. 'Peltigera malacea cyanobiont' DB3992]
MQWDSFCWLWRLSLIRNPYWWTHLAAKQLGHDKLQTVQCDRAWLRSQLGLIELQPPQTLTV